MEEEIKKLVGGAMAGILSSVPLWLILIVAAVFGFIFLYLFFPIILVSVSAMVSFMFLERAGVRGYPLFLVPLIVCLLVSLPVMVSSAAVASVSSMGVGKVIGWFAHGPLLFVMLGVGAFVVLFLFNIFKVGLVGSLIAGVIGVVLGLGITVGVFGTGPDALSVSTISEEGSLPLYPVLGALVGGIVCLLLLSRSE